MMENEAYRFVLSALVRNARGDVDGMDLLADQVDSAEDLPELLWQALSVAYAAHECIAQITGVSVEDQLEEIILEAASS